jgi:winged helix-turn-helix protein
MSSLAGSSPTLARPSPRGSVVIGHRLGLYRALAAGPATAGELAARTGTSARYLAEWLCGQAAGGYIEYDAATGAYSMTEEQAFALANPDGDVYVPGAFVLALGALRAEPRIAEAFRTGAGMGWHEHDGDVFAGCEQFFRPGLCRPPGALVDSRPRRGGRQAVRRCPGRRHRLRARCLDDPARPRLPELGERAAAAAEQQALSRAGIELTLQGYPSAKFFTNFVGVPNYVHQNGLGLAISGWGPDWPDGFGFLYYLTAGAAIRPAGNYNISELNDPVVNGLFTKALATTDTAARTRIWSQIDRQVMSDAVILPGIYAKWLLYRSPHLTNVYVHRYYANYDYANLGLK